MKPVMTGILCVVVFLLIRAGFSSWVQNQLAPTATSKAASCLEMAGSTTSEEDGNTYIIGDLKNTCGRKFASVTVIFKLDRPRGGTGNVPEAIVTAHAQDVMPGETRRFKSGLPIGKNLTYRFDTLVSY